MNTDSGSCIDNQQTTTLEKISRQSNIDRDSSTCDDLQMLRAFTGDEGQLQDHRNLTTTRIPDGGSCTDLQFLESISHTEFQPKPAPSPNSFSKMRYIRDGGSSNDLQKLEKMTEATQTSAPNFWDDSQILCDDNSEELIQGTVNFLSQIPTVEMYQMAGQKPHHDDGFTLEELSEMETSGSSDVTSLMVPKEEYDFSSFEEFSFEGSQLTESHSAPPENDSSFWSHMLGSDAGSEQSTFPTMMDELPAMIRFLSPGNFTSIS